MRIANNVKPISYLKGEAAQIVKDLAEFVEPLIIIQDGDAKLVVQDLRSYESDRQTLALLKTIALGQKQIEQGKFSDIEEVFAELDELDRQEKRR
ncbi:prevent-host-death protein [Cupriavidus basilensis]|nr:prevent-host-death protein [Cupriavidus sp. UYMU48A]ODV42829.1 prevent-host-death protein [Cupriavidus sp. UYMMa02A]